MAPTQVPPAIIKAMAAVNRGLFRLTGGRLGGKLGQVPVGLLTTTGRRSGKPRTQPLTTLPHGEGWAVTASYSGHDVHPAWYLNLQAKPEAELTLGRTTHRVRARDTEGDERDLLWQKFIDGYGGYAEYEKATDRQIPVVALEPIEE